MIYNECPGCGATDEEKKNCCGVDNDEKGEPVEEISEEKEEDELQEEFEKE